MAKGYKLKWHGKQIYTKVQKAERRAMYKAARLVKDDVRRSFVGQATSRAGEVPGIDTGKLMKSIRYRVFITKAGNVIGLIGSRAKHALHLEVGTRKMAKRPYLRPAIKRLSWKIARILAGAKI